MRHRSWFGDLGDDDPGDDTVAAGATVWLRRVNEHHVDLNRNCLAPDEAYAGAPDGYNALRLLAV